MTRIIDSLAQITAPYDAAFVDLWGCMHNGIEAIPSAVAACQQFRAAGGTVVLVTNSPRPWKDVAAQIEGFGVPQSAWDAIATSGDSARAAMFRGAVGENVWVIKGDEDTGFFAPMSVIDDPAQITQVPYDQADGIVCLGPQDPMADPAVYRPQFLHAKQRGLKLLCANPDIVVDRGETREWCAGALAALYTDMGGESLYFGKPHPPIYDLARRRLAALGLDFAADRILCIGDGIATDIQGGMGEDMDTLFISGGLARADTMTGEAIDPDRLAAYVAAQAAPPTYAIATLR